MSYYRTLEELKESDEDLYATEPSRGKCPAIKAYVEFLFPVPWGRNLVYWHYELKNWVAYRTKHPFGID